MSWPEGSLASSSSEGRDPAPGPSEKPSERKAGLGKAPRPLEPTLQPLPLSGEAHGAVSSKDFL
eukprot:4694505-Pyramimonas_sp.AAC.1